MSYRGQAYRDGSSYMTLADKQAFFQNLGKSQREFFDKMLSENIWEAKLTARYLCLNGEEMASSSECAREIGRVPVQSSASIYTASIYAVMHILDPDLDVSASAKGVAKRILLRMARPTGKWYLRQERRNTVQELCEKEGVVTSDGRLDKAIILIVEERQKILRPELKRRLQRLKEEHPIRYRAAALYYGLEDGVIRTMEDVGEIMGSSRENIRQLRNKALKFLEAPLGSEDLMISREDTIRDVLEASDGHPGRADDGSDLEPKIDTERPWMQEVYRVNHLVKLQTMLKNARKP